MDETKILHVMILDKFLAPFIDFVDKHFGRKNHHYVFITSEKYHYGLTPEHNVEFLHTDEDIFITLHRYMKMAKKIILHGLWRDKVDILLCVNQALLKKCYWIIWGGDFYFPEKQTKIRHEVIKNIGNFIYGNEGDKQYIIDHYGSKARAYKSFVYTSNFCIEQNFIKNRKDNFVNILVGNSATETNCHFEVFNKLAKHKQKNIKIFVPLSYGNNQYAEDVITYGEGIFHEKLIPLKNFMPFDKYVNFLNNMDIIIFGHNRQQGMSNLVITLGFGKKVYMKTNTTHCELFKNLGIYTFDFNQEIDIGPINELIKVNNILKIKDYFSEKTLLCQLELIFETKIEGPDESKIN